MKQAFTLSLFLFSFTVFSQQKSAVPKSEKPATPQSTVSTSETDKNPRSAATSGKSQSKAATPLPYDVDDKYMGRKAEFLNNLTVSELPADFPVYEKQWGLKEYNQVVDAFYLNHQDILKEKVKAKIIQLQH